VADVIHAAGAKFLVWFELERVRPGTDIDREHSDWLAFQPNRPQNRDGLIIALRRKDCYMERIQVNLNGLDEEASYDLLYLHNNVTSKQSGRELLNGFELCNSQKPGSLVIKYELAK